MLWSKIIRIETYVYFQLCLGKTVFTSDHALKLEWIPDWIAIVGSGYIGLEFSDVYTALGSEVKLFSPSILNVLMGLPPLN